MNRFFSSIILACSLDAQTAQLTIKEEVMKVDEIYRTAKLNRDINTLDSILADGFNDTNQNGNSRNKSETIELWRNFHIASSTTDTHEIRENGSTAMVIGTQTENGSERMLFTRVYVKNSNGWQLSQACNSQSQAVATVALGVVTRRQCR